jgi:hypothetical protein
MQAPRLVLIRRCKAKRHAQNKKLAAAVVQLDGSIFIWHMTDWFSVFNGLLFIWGAFKKSKPRLRATPTSPDQLPAPPWTQRVPGGVKFRLLASLIAQLVLLLLRQAQSRHAGSRSTQQLPTGLLAACVLHSRWLQSPSCATPVISNAHAAELHHSACATTLPNALLERKTRDWRL